MLHKSPGNRIFLEHMKQERWWPSSDPSALAARTIDGNDIEALRSRKPLSREELIAEALSFANTGSQNACRRVLAGAPLPAEGDRDLGRVEQALAEERAALREGLSAIATGQVTKAMLNSWGRRADGLLLVPSHGADGHQRYRYLQFEMFDPMAPSPSFSLALWFLAREELHQCQYKACSAFFRKPNRQGSGRIPDKYCPGTDHHNLDAAGRRARKKSRRQQARRSR